MSGMPPAWRIVTHNWWGLPEPLSRDFWLALLRSQWSGPRAFRQQLGLLGSMTIDTEHFVQTIYAPQKVMSVLEDLQTEGKLTRRKTTQIEDRILSWVGSDGRWKEAVFQP